MPKPARITVRFLSAVGVQLTPTRGLNAFIEVVAVVRLPSVTNRSPPAGLNWLAGSCDKGAFAYAALAATVVELVAEGSKPTTCRFHRSVVGLLYSQRRPRFTVRFGR